MARLQVVSSDQIKSGYVDYTIDGDTINYSYNINVSLGFFFNKTYADSGSFQGAPGEFTKGTWKKAGVSFDLPEGFSAKIGSIQGDSAFVNVSGPYSVQGVATADVSGAESDPIVVREIHGKGNFLGFDIQVSAVSV